MFERPEMVIVFGKKKTKIRTPPSNVLRLITIMPEFSYLAHVLTVTAIGIAAIKTSLVLFYIFACPAVVYFIIRAVMGLDPIEIFVYKDRIVTHGITGEGFALSFFFIVMPSVLSYSVIINPSGKNLFPLLVYLFTLALVYFVWDKSYSIDFSRRKISRRFLLFSMPYETFDYIGGIDKAFKHWGPEEFFYKLWIRGEHYAVGVPLSGSIGKYDKHMQKIYADHVLAKFEGQGHAKNCPDRCLPQVDKYLTLKLKSGMRILVSDMDPLFVYSYFTTFGGAFTRLYLKEISVMARNSLGEYISMMVFGPEDSEKVDRYIENLSRTFSIQPEVILLDNRLS